MATVGAQQPGLTGVTPSLAAASGGGDKVPPGSRVHVVNGSGSPIDVTIVTPGTVEGLAIADRVITVPDGVFPANCKAFDVPGRLYADPTDGLVSLQWSSASDVSFWVEGPVNQ